MCKLSLNIVPNVYNSLQSSFLSLAWPWPGRSLPKGNQWENWDPGLGPNVVRLPTHLPPQCTPDTPNSPLTPLGTLKFPLMPPIPLLAPEYLHSLPAPNTPLTPLGASNVPLYHLYPFWLLSTYTPSQPQYTPDTPMPLTVPTPLGDPNVTLCHLYPIWPQSTYTPCQPPIHSQHPLMAPQHP